jgi:hypothetical protein
VVSLAQMRATNTRDSVAETETRPVLREPPYMTGNDLLQSGLIGMWGKRRDIRDSACFARRLRTRASKRTPS